MDAWLATGRSHHKERLLNYLNRDFNWAWTKTWHPYAPVGVVRKADVAVMFLWSAMTQLADIAVSSSAGLLTFTIECALAVVWTGIGWSSDDAIPTWSDGVLLTTCVDISADESMQKAVASTDIVMFVDDSTLVAVVLFTGESVPADNDSVGTVLSITVSVSVLVLMFFKTSLLPRFISAVITWLVVVGDLTVFVTVASVVPLELIAVPIVVEVFIAHPTNALSFAVLSTPAAGLFILFGPLLIFLVSERELAIGHGCCSVCGMLVQLCESLQSNNKGVKLQHSLRIHCNIYTSNSYNSTT